MLTAAQFPFSIYTVQEPLPKEWFFPQWTDLPMWIKVIMPSTDMSKSLSISQEILDPVKLTIYTIQNIKFGSPGFRQGL